MGRKKYGTLTDVYPKNPEITKDFLINLGQGLLLALKDAGYITDPQLRRAMTILEQSWCDL